jgi:glycosyltransferase involved in cell wall biosynthesis
MTPWLIVSGDFTRDGGMDVANYSLVRSLSADPTAEIHVVAHRVSPELDRVRNVHVHRAVRPFGAHRFGEPILRIAAERWARALQPRGVRAIANGGNADMGDVSWVHYVHAAFEPRYLRARIWPGHPRYVRDERAALHRARLVICNSRRTADDVVERVGVARERTRVVYYGIDGARYRPLGDSQRRRARATLGLPSTKPVALFVGGLGDARKGFDTLFEAWRRLCGSTAWDADLLVAGSGAELALWQARAGELPPGRVRFLGFRRDIPLLMTAADLLVHPARYEPYGLSVHEALCAGLPAIVAGRAGVAERYPSELRSLLLQDPESVDELIFRLEMWSQDPSVRERVLRFAPQLRSRTWGHMGADIAGLVDEVHAA